MLKPLILSTATNFDAERTNDTIEAKLWVEEHNSLYALLKSEQNVSPTFRFPDLISACVSPVFTNENAAARIFDFFGTELVLRMPRNPRRRESMWITQYDLLLPLQRSSAVRFLLFGNAVSHVDARLAKHICSHTRTMLSRTE